MFLSCKILIHCYYHIATEDLGYDARGAWWCCMDLCSFKTFISATLKNIDKQNYQLHPLRHLYWQLGVWESSQGCIVSLIGFLEVIVSCENPCGLDGNRRENGDVKQGNRKVTSSAPLTGVFMWRAFMWSQQKAEKLILPLPHKCLLHLGPLNLGLQHLFKFGRY